MNSNRSEDFQRSDRCRLASLRAISPGWRLRCTSRPNTARSFEGSTTRAGRVISLQTAEAAEKLLFEFLLPHTFGLYDVVANGGQDRDTVRAIGDFILASDKDRLRPSDLTAGVRRLRNQPAIRSRSGPAGSAPWAGFGRRMKNSTRRRRGWSSPACGLILPRAASSTGGPRRRTRDPKSRRDPAMIGSDKFTVNGRSRTSSALQAIRHLY